MNEEGKNYHYYHHGHHHDHHHDHHHQPPAAVTEYGAFQAPPQPVVGFPQSVPPPSEYYALDHHHHEKSQPSAPPPPALAEYGTFQAPPQPVIGFPPPSEYYARGYQSVPGYVVDERGAVREPRLRYCGLGLGWFLFIIGFFLAGVPWYVATFILLCSRSVDHREKSGFVACSIATVIAAIGIVFDLAMIYSGRWT